MCHPPLGTTDISFIDPVVIGRNAFSATNDFVSGVAAYIQDVLCAVLDVALDSLQGRVPTPDYNVYWIKRRKQLVN